MAKPIPHRQALDTVEELHDRLGFTYRELAVAIHADEATLHRWRDGVRKGSGAAPSPVYLARLAALQAFLDELRRTFRRWEDAAAWDDRPAGVPRRDASGAHPRRPRGSSHGRALRAERRRRRMSGARRIGA